MSPIALKKLGLIPHTAANTAVAARRLAEAKDPSKAAIASSLAAEIYGLDIIAANIADADHNTTRFIILSREPDWAPRGNGPTVTTFVFKLRNAPATLYKALGGFATNSVNMTKLESYQLEGEFVATQFYADVEGHPDDSNVSLALAELAFFSAELKILGVYPAHPLRFAERMKPQAAAAVLTQRRHDGRIAAVTPCASVSSPEQARREPSLPASPRRWTPPHRNEVPDYSVSDAYMRIYGPTA